MDRLFFYQQLWGKKIKETNIHKNLHKREMKLHLRNKIVASEYGLKFNEPTKAIKYFSAKKSFALLKCLNYTTICTPFLNYYYVMHSDRCRSMTTTRSLLEPRNLDFVVRIHYFKGDN